MPQRIMVLIDKLCFFHKKTLTNLVSERNFHAISYYNACLSVCRDWCRAGYRVCRDECGCGDHADAGDVSRDGSVHGGRDRSGVGCVGERGFGVHVREKQKFRYSRRHRDDGHGACLHGGGQLHIKSGAAGYDGEFLRCHDAVSRDQVHSAPGDDDAGGCFRGIGAVPCGEIHRLRSGCGVHLRLCRRGRRYDDAAFADERAAVRPEDGGRDECVHHDVYGVDGIAVALCHWRRAAVVSVYSMCAVHVPICADRGQDREQSDAEDAEPRHGSNSCDPGDCGTGIFAGDEMKRKQKKHCICPKMI